MVLRRLGGFDQRIYVKLPVKPISSWGSNIDDAVLSQGTSLALSQIHVALAIPFQILPIP